VRRKVNGKHGRLGAAPVPPLPRYPAVRSCCTRARTAGHLKSANNCPAFDVNGSKQASDARSTLSELPDAQVQTINSFIDELLEWNQKMNITAIRTREEAMSRHVEDSLALLPVLEAHAVPVRGSDTLRLIDVGSGGGLPGLLLAIARPQWQVTLLDSLRKRCDFVTATIKKLGIQNVTVVWSRAEDAGQNEAHREEYDVAVARAVAEMRVLVELCLPLVRTNGCLVAAKGPTPEDEISKAKKALSEVKGHVTEVIQVASFGSEGQQFTAVVVKKEQTCPKKYPRQAGTPKKNPL